MANLWASQGLPQMLVIAFFDVLCMTSYTLIAILGVSLAKKSISCCTCEMPPQLQRRFHATQKLIQASGKHFFKFDVAPQQQICLYVYPKTICAITSKVRRFQVVSVH